MATIKQRKKSFSVIYWYLDNTGERKQKWDTLGTRKEAKQRKAFVELAQLVEHLTFNQVVRGSNPRCLM